LLCRVTRTLTLGQLEAALAIIHDIASERRSALQARIKNFLKLGFPAGVAAGRGKAAAFDAESVMQMVFAFELVQCGLPPSTIVSVINANWRSMLPAIIFAGTPSQHRPSGKGRWPDQKLFFCVAPEAMHDLTGKSDDVDAYKGSVEVLHLNELQKRLYNSTEVRSVGSFARSIVLNVPFKVLSTMVILKGVKSEMEYSGLIEDLTISLHRHHDLHPQA